MNPSSLETRLFALGGALDHPTGEALIARVAADLDAGAIAPARVRHRSSHRLIALVAATAVVVAAVVIEPSRRAIADLFRVGGVEVRNANDFHPAASTTTTATRPDLAYDPDPIATAQAAVDFPIRLPHLVPSRTPTVTVDRSVPGGLVTLDYGEFRVVEVAARPGQAVLAKGIDPRTRIMPTPVRDTTGYWFTGTHHLIAYLDRDGNIRQDTARTAGHVLLWAADGVTFRVEGFHTLRGAQEIARTIQ